MEKKPNSTKEDGLLVQLAHQCGADSEKWFGDFPGKYSIPHHTLAMCGEVGEFANIVKKIERGSLSIHDAKVRYELAMELTDIFVYLLNLANLLHVDLEKTYYHVRGLNDARFTKAREERAKLNGGQ